MNTNLQVTFPGTCDEAFTFYEHIFNTKRTLTMRYSDAPEGTPVPEGARDLIMHTSMQLGSMLLMGADMPPERQGTVGGFEISLDTPDEAEVRRMFAALSEGGEVIMPLMPTFWTPLFGMLNDKFGIGWDAQRARPAAGLGSQSCVQPVPFAAPNYLACGQGPHPGTLV